MSSTAGNMMVCPHVLDGFNDGSDVVCQMDTDSGKINVATCRPCIEEVLKGNMEAWDRYKAVTAQHAAVLGIVIAGQSGAAAS